VLKRSKIRGIVNVNMVGFATKCNSVYITLQVLSGGG